MLTKHVIAHLLKLSLGETTQHRHRIGDGFSNIEIGKSSRFAFTGRKAADEAANLLTAKLATVSFGSRFGFIAARLVLT